MLLAVLIESFYKRVLPWKEPPITRFGVGVLGYSKTFNVSKCLDILGPPSVSLEEGFERFICWQKETWGKEAGCC